MADLTALFEEYEKLLLASPVVTQFNIAKRRIVEREGFIRGRAELTGGGLLEFSEFWSGEEGEEITLREYTYHWQDAEGQLVQRWDNAPHHPDLPHAPNHVHFADGTTQGNPQPPTLQSVLNEIEPQTSTSGSQHE